MAKGQYLSKHQQGIVKRYYAHADARLANTLQELVSDLAVSDAKGAEKLWKKAGDVLEKLKVDHPRARRAIEARDTRAFAEVVGEVLSRPGALGGG